MNYKKLGNTDLNVSTICLGTMTWGEQNTQEEGFEQMDYALDQGVNFWDTAELYAVPPREETYGHTEIIIGNWIKKSKKRLDNKISLRLSYHDLLDNEYGHLSNSSLKTLDFEFRYNFKKVEPYKIIIAEINKLSPKQTTLQKDDSYAWSFISEWRDRDFQCDFCKILHTNLGIGLSSTFSKNNFFIFNNIKCTKMVNVGYLYIWDISY